MERPSRRSSLARSAAEVLGDGLMRRTRSETWMLSTGVVPVVGSLVPDATAPRLARGQDGFALLI